MENNEHEIRSLKLVGGDTDKRLDILLGFLDEDDEFCILHYDSRRFEPYTGTGME